MRQIYRFFFFCCLSNISINFTTPMTHRTYIPIIHQPLKLKLFFLNSLVKLRNKHLAITVDIIPEELKNAHLRGWKFVK